MQPIEIINIFDFFPSPEGEIDLIYGRIGQGKTLLATIDILRRLRRGEVVYCNWRIKVPKHDERTMFGKVLLSLLGWKRRLYDIDISKNLKYFPIDDEYAQKQGHEDFTDWLSKLTDCSVYLDEGHVIFDSYQHAKFSMRKRTAILHTRHFNRTIVVVSQRPTAIHVSARANVNRFFKVERPFAFVQNLFKILFFVKTEYQDMKDETVDEEEPVSTKWYWPSRSTLKAYDTKYLRGDIPTSQMPIIAVYTPTTLENLKLILQLLPFVGRGFRRAPRPQRSPLTKGDIKNVNKVNIT